MARGQQWSTTPFTHTFLLLDVFAARTQVFAMLFSPRAIAVVITVIVIILVGVIMAVYYLYKKWVHLFVVEVPILSNLLAIALGLWRAATSVEMFCDRPRETGQSEVLTCIHLAQWCMSPWVSYTWSINSLNNNNNLAQRSSYEPILKIALSLEGFRYLLLHVRLATWDGC